MKAISRVANHYNGTESALGRGASCALGNFDSLEDWSRQMSPAAAQHNIAYVALSLLKAARLKVDT